MDLQMNIPNPFVRRPREVSEVYKRFKDETTGNEYMMSTTQFLGGG